MRRGGREKTRLDVCPPRQRQGPGEGQLALGLPVSRPEVETTAPLLFLSTSCDYKTIKHLGADSQFITSPLFFLSLFSTSSHTEAQTYEKCRNHLISLVIESHTRCIRGSWKNMKLILFGGYVHYEIFRLSVLTSQAAGWQ